MVRVEAEDPDRESMRLLEALGRLVQDVVELVGLKRPGAIAVVAPLGKAGAVGQALDADRKPAVPPIGRHERRQHERNAASWRCRLASGASDVVHLGSLGARARNAPKNYPRRANFLRNLGKGIEKADNLPRFFA